MPNQNQLIISSTPISQDDNNRYCLNNLHKAAGNQPKHKPSEWLRNKQTIELIAEIEKAGITAIQSKQQVGTFAVKELVYSYAMWISPVFSLKVIRAYDALVNQPSDYLKPITAPITIAELEARNKYHTDALAELKNVSVIVSGAEYLEIQQALNSKVMNKLFIETFTPNPTENHHNRWTETEKQTLLTYRAQGLSYKKIAAKMGRTVYAVKHAVAKYIVGVNA